MAARARCLRCGGPLHRSSSPSRLGQLAGVVDSGGCESRYGPVLLESGDYLELMHSEVPTTDGSKTVARACGVPGAPVRPGDARLEPTGQTLGGCSSASGRRADRNHPAARCSTSAASVAGRRVTADPGAAEDALPPGRRAVFSDSPSTTSEAGQRGCWSGGGGPARRWPFVLGDVVVPVDPADSSPRSTMTATTGRVRSPIKLGWLEAAGFTAGVAWAHRDLAVLVGDRAGSGGTAARGPRARGSGSDESGSAGAPSGSPASGA